MNFSLFCPNKCRGCAEAIYPNHSVYRLINGSVLYHEFCFKCDYCAIQLTSGKLIYVTKTEPLLICCSSNCLSAKQSLFGNDSIKNDGIPTNSKSGVAGSKSELNESVELKPTTSKNRSVGKSHHKSSLPNSATVDCSSDPKNGGKRGPRTSIQQHQLNMLNQTFNANPKPSKHARAKLALQTSLSTRVIQVGCLNYLKKLNLLI